MMKKNMFLKALLTMSAVSFTSAQASVSLFTTADDFAGSSGGSAFNVTPTTAVDLDGSTINGLGNTTAPGGTGTLGSLSLTWVSGSYDYLYIGNGQAGNANFISALENAATLSFENTTPTTSSGNYFQLGLVLNYQGGFDQLSSTATDLGGGITRETIDFSSEAATLISKQAANGGSFNYFNLGIIYNSNWTPTSSFNIDNFQVTPVPEPAAAGAMAAGALVVCSAASSFFRRRRAA